ncbi:hypothetical protein [Allosphingosinicella deserti]|uniref:Uncharacterized protein n=1 Tax=Allosphingosinicella deserti TaxID=2116704 RepID=A0A2P7QI92_9SPHN|nr:hypothetical protein [Sphingomonas deserti]PSJ37683.1 hypothetical protein C7I55_21730 [Sphingomonas deserti]
MSTSDDEITADPIDPNLLSRAGARGVDSLLLEALVHVLIEKGVLTKNDALSVVETVAQIVKGEVDDREAADSQTAAAVRMLKRMYVSFEALEDRPGVVTFDGENVHRMRRPVHGDRPSFPLDD